MPTVHAPNTDLKRIMKLEVPIIVRLAQRPASVDELLGLIPGAIIDLQRPAEDELDLLVNNKQIGSGIAVKIGENFGIQITLIGNVEDRIHAMGPQKEESETVSNEDIASMLLEGMI